jgi:hypothetical protein
MWKEAAVAYSEVILHLLECLKKTKPHPWGTVLQNTNHCNRPSEVSSVIWQRHLTSEAARHRVAKTGLASSIGVK